jgi:hypothetical protein
VFRVPKSYPVYDADYRGYLTQIKEFLATLENFQTIGRNGLHRYNNQDHAMLTGMFAVRNALDGESFDLWSVNADQEYHEEIREAREVVTDRVLDEALATTFAKLDRFSFGVATGVTAGLVLLLATIILVVRGGPSTGLHLGLLRNYFPGYDVSLVGSLLGLGYGLLTGFIFGWMFAFLRNAFVFLYLAMARRSAERQLIQKLIQHL